MSISKLMAAFALAALAPGVGAQGMGGEMPAGMGAMQGMGGEMPMDMGGEQAAGMGPMPEGMGAMMNGVGQAPGLAAFDSDGDGRVSEQEFLTGRAERMAQMAQQGGNMANAGSMPQFSDLDSDDDGFLSGDELTGMMMGGRNMPGTEESGTE